MLKFLSPAWVEYSSEAASDLAFGSGGIRLQIQFPDALAGPSCYYQVFADGRLREAGVGPLRAPDLTLSMVAADASALLTRPDSGAEAMGRVRAVPDVSASEEALPPCDLVNETAGFTAMPEVPITDLVVQHEHVLSPWGTIAFWEGFQRGRRTQCRLGETDQATIHITRTYARALRRRAGDLTSVESFKGGQVSGDWREIMLLAGLTDGTEYRQASGRRRDVLRPLAYLSEVMAQPDYAVYRQRLSAQTL